MNRLTKEEALKKLLEIRAEGSMQNSLVQKLAQLSVPKTDKEVFDQTTRENPLLGAIGMTESSGGTNYKHEMDPRSGTTAGGMFGMMPATAMDALKMNPDLAAQYPEMAKANNQAFTDRFNSDPEAAADFAKATFERNKAKTGSDEGGVYSWYNGLTQALRARNRGGLEELQNSPYVQKVKENLENQDDQPPEEVANLDLNTFVRRIK